MVEGFKTAPESEGFAGDPVEDRQAQGQENQGNAKSEERRYDRFPQKLADDVGAAGADGFADAKVVAELGFEPTTSGL